MTGDHVSPNAKSHIWAGMCVEDRSRTTYTHLVQKHMAADKCNPTTSHTLHALQHATPQVMYNIARLIMNETLTLNDFENTTLKWCSGVHRSLTCQGTKCDRLAIHLYSYTTVYYVMTIIISTNISNAVMYVGLSELASIAAITHPTLQILEMHNTAPHSACAL